MTDSYVVVIPSECEESFHKVRFHKMLKLHHYPSAISPLLGSLEIELSFGSC